MSFYRGGSGSYSFCRSRISSHTRTHPPRTADTATILLLPTLTRLLPTFELPALLLLSHSHCYSNVEKTTKKRYVRRRQMSSKTTRTKERRARRRTTRTRKKKKRRMSYKTNPMWTWMRQSKTKKLSSPSRVVQQGSNWLLSERVHCRKWIQWTRRKTPWNKVCPWNMPAPVPNGSSPWMTNK